MAVAASVTGIGACGLSREDAEEWCNQLRDNDPFGTTCITDEAFDECVSCSLECGKCRKLNTCPQSFECFE